VVHGHQEGFRRHRDSIECTDNGTGYWVGISSCRDISKESWGTHVLHGTECKRRYYGNVIQYGSILEQYGEHDDNAYGYVVE